jgi:Ca-activated chloride channel family protein
MNVVGPYHGDLYGCFSGNGEEEQDESSTGGGGLGYFLQKSIILLFDASGSMKDNNKIDNAKIAAKNALKGLDSTTEVALIVFYDCSNIVVEEPFTTDHEKIRAKIDTIQPYGGTPLADAIAFAEDYKKNAKSDNRVVVLFTDGIETCK